MTGKQAIAFILLKQWNNWYYRWDLGYNEFIQWDDWHNEIAMAYANRKEEWWT